MLEQALGDLLRARLLGADPDREGLQAAVEQVPGQRVEQGAGDDAHLADLHGPAAARGDDAGDHVAVATEELGGAMEHEGGALRDRLLQHWCREGGVHQDRDAAGLADHGGDVHQVERRVPRGLHDHQRRVGPQRPGDPVGPGVGDLMPEQPALEQVVGAAVERAHGDHVAAPLLHGEEHRRHRRHARGEGHGLVRALERRERLLEAGHGRVVQPGVDGAAHRRAASGHRVIAGGGLIEV